MTDPSDDGDEDKDRPTMSADGRREGQWKPAAQPLDTGPAAPLELVEQAPRLVEERIEAFRDDPPEPPSRAWVFKLGLVVLLIAAAAGGGFFFYTARTPIPYGVRDSTLVDSIVGPGENGPLIITSSPAGATIIIDGQVIGETPWAGDNRWRGETSLVIKRAGYQQWEGRLQGGKEQTLNIPLKK